MCEMPNNFPLNQNQIEEALRVIRARQGNIGFYLESYPRLVEAVRGLAATEANDEALAHLAYGWMPTSLSSHMLHPYFWARNQTMLAAIRKLASSQEAHDFLVGLPGAPINNSWVGSSKALHFARPDLFPIWDSNVGRVFGAVYHHQVNTQACYAAYLLAIHRWLEAAPGLSAKVNEAIGNDVSPVRALELLLFAHGQEIL